MPRNLERVPRAHGQSHTDAPQHPHGACVTAPPLTCSLLGHPVGAHTRHRGHSEARAGRPWGSSHSRTRALSSGDPSLGPSFCPDRLSGWIRWRSACPASPLTCQLWKAGWGWLPGKGQAEARAWRKEAGPQTRAWPGSRAPGGKTGCGRQGPELVLPQGLLHGQLRPRPPLGPRPGCAYAVHLRRPGPGTAQPPRALAVPASFPGPLLPAAAGAVGGALGLLGAEVGGGGTARGGAPRAVLSSGQASRTQERSAQRSSLGPQDAEPGASLPPPPPHSLPPRPPTLTPAPPHTLTPAPPQCPLPGPPMRWQGPQACPRKSAPLSHDGPGPVALPPVEVFTPGPHCPPGSGWSLPPGRHLSRLSAREGQRQRTLLPTPHPTLMETFRPTGQGPGCFLRRLWASGGEERAKDGLTLSPRHKAPQLH